MLALDMNESKYVNICFSKSVCVYKYICVYSSNMYIYTYKYIYMCAWLEYTLTLFTGIVYFLTLLFNAILMK